MLEISDSSLAQWEFYSNIIVPGTQHSAKAQRTPPPVVITPSKAPAHSTKPRTHPPTVRKTNGFHYILLLLLCLAPAGAEEKPRPPRRYILVFFPARRLPRQTAGFQVSHTQPHRWIHLFVPIVWVVWVRAGCVGSVGCVGCLCVGRTIIVSVIVEI